MRLSRTRRWLVALVTATMTAAVMVAWFGWAYARADPRFEQLPPGEPGRVDGLELRVTAIRQATSYHDPLQKKVVAAAEGTRIIQVSGEVRGLRENPECELRLVGTNRRQWISLTWHVRACARQGQTTELILLFEVPERDVAAIAGLAHLPRRQLARTPVVTPAEPR